MAASPKRVPMVIRRTSRVALDLPTKATPAYYLLHRVAADEAYRRRQRLRLRNRIIVVCLAGLFYLVIGRNLISLSRAKADSTSMEVQHDPHQFTAELRKLIGPVTNPKEQTPSLTVPSALSTTANANVNRTEGNFSLSPQPVAMTSRLDGWE